MLRNVGFCWILNNKLNPHIAPSPGIEPGTHWWGTSALTSAPSLLPLKQQRWSKGVSHTLFQALLQINLFDNCPT